MVSHATGASFNSQIKVQKKRLSATKKFNLEKQKLAFIIFISLCL